MELRQLQYFIAAADFLNFSRAADSLYISQSTLSQQIAGLENELGVQLFIRNSRSVLLTAAGAELLDRAKDLLHRSQYMIQAVKNASDTSCLEGDLCICFESLVAHDTELLRKLSCASLQMRRSYPNIRLFYCEDHFHGGEDFHAVPCDLRLTVTPPNINSDKYNRLRLKDVPMVLCFSAPEQPENTRECLVHELERRTVFLQNKETRGFSHAMQLFSELGVSPKINFMEALYPSLLILASGENSAMLLPDGYPSTDPFPELHKLYFDSPNAVLSVILQWDKENANPAIQLFIDCLNSCLEENQLLIVG